MCWFEYVGRTCVIINNSYRQNLQSHLISELPLHFIVLDRFLKLCNRVVILVSEFPPIGAQLTNVINLGNFETLYQLGKFLVNFSEILKVELDVAI